MANTYTPQIRIPNVKKLFFGHVVWEVEICGNDYVVAELIASNSWSTKKASQLGNSTYNRGMLNSPDDEQKAERIGALAEIAYASVFKTSVCAETIEGGDAGYDFVTTDGTIDIKAFCMLNTISKDWRGLLRATTQSGDGIDLRAEMYAWIGIKEDRANRKARAQFVGWQRAKRISKMPTRPSPRSDAGHSNHELSCRDLEAMTVFGPAVDNDIGQTLPVQEAPRFRPTPFQRCSRVRLAA